MKRLMLIIALLAAAGSDLQLRADAQDNSMSVAQMNGQQQLSSVRKIFVGSFGTAAGSEMIRQRMINRLSKCSDVTLVSEADKADATLLGSAAIEHHRTFSLGPGFVSSIPKFHADVVVRLEDKDKKSLWTDEISAKKNSSKMTPKGACSAAADRMTGELLEAIGVGGSQVAAKKPSSSQL